jgi:hypothetical protein
MILVLAVVAPAAWPRQQQTPQEEPTTQQREVWNIGVHPPNWTGTSSLEIVNRCRHNHLFEVLVSNLPFLRFLADTHHVPVAGRNSKELPVQFDTSGMEPGSYNGQVIVHCIDCPKEPTCTQDREYVPVQLAVAKEPETPQPNQPNQPPSEPQESRPPETSAPQQPPPTEEPKQPNVQKTPPPNVPQERTNQSKENEEEEYFLPAGMTRLNRAAALKWWASPFPPPGVFWWWWCCCCCPTPQVAPAQAPKAGPGPAPKPPINVTLSLIVGRFGPGKAIHIVYVAYGGQYLAETYLQWSASGGSGQLTVELEVQRPGSSRWDMLASGRGPNDEYLFSTRVPGTYLFRVTARDSAGQSSFNTLSVTFPSI